MNSPVSVRISVLVSAVLGMCFASSAVADWMPLTGHIKGQYQTQSWPSHQLALEENPTYLTAADFRLNSGYEQARWQFHVSYQLNAEYGTSTQLQKRLSPWQNPDEQEVFNATQKLWDDNDTTVWQRLDRFNLSYTETDYSLRVGRQALSWGRGNVFNPMDLFNPFSPYAIDTEYKPGTDMINAQWLSPSGNDLSAVFIPRRNLTHGELDISQSSSAMKWHQLDERLEWQAMVARDYRDWVGSLSLSGDVAEASWNLDWVPTYVTEEDALKHSFVVNVNYAWQWFEHNFTGFVEYYFNGFGEPKARPNLDQLNETLMIRQERNQVFVINQQYLDAGFSLEVTPLLTLSPSLIQNLHDSSGLFMVSSTYSLADDRQLLLGAQIPYGDQGTEYGGLYISEDAEKTVSQPVSFFAQLNMYF